jgi:glycosyltransferase involved in cell wall biosynthesis
MARRIKTVCLISFSNIGVDGRIRRHGDLLHDMGFDVRGVGLSGPAAARPPLWPIRTIDDAPWERREIAVQAGRLLLARPFPKTAARSYWKSTRFQAMYDAAGPQHADLYVANDWNTLPIAARLAAEHGAAYAYDTHEYAVEEKADRRKWRLVWPPFLRALEGALIPGAVYVTTVSDGIAALIQRDHALARRPVVIRNAPAYVETPFREPANPLVVLFHGGLNEDRGLEQLIDSVRLWSSGQRLLIRGNGDATYLDKLRRLAAASPAAHRIAFEPAVAPAEVVSGANATADIGIHPMPAVSNQTRFALPNKFFEYTMAGLALCVLEGTEMGSLVEQFTTGALMNGSSAEAIAAAINAMDQSAVREFKRHSLTAARTLAWESEVGKLQALYAAER